ncbi:hypothetical protein [uncultured Dokdonia sp.]|uniref:hypothetical protein n=1 Tax=uncultured Dokdonia sp. TaxID=575653 RepID=UPI002603C62E|nr:hypothetical protein [uncultured Dokdonia sp.]
MKTLLKTTSLFLLLILISCGNDDDNSNSPQEMEIETASIIGSWERISGTLLFAEPDYLHIALDNTVTMLLEDDLGFRGEGKGNFTNTEGQITIQFGLGNPNILNYTIEDNILELLQANGTISTFIRNTEAPSSDEWITKLEILAQVDAPAGNAFTDIAFNGTHILLSNSQSGNNIDLLNPETLTLDGEIITTLATQAVEVEKFDLPDKYIFQRFSGVSTTIQANFENTNEEAFTSIELGSSIFGLASINSTQIWLSSPGSLSLLDYTFINSQVIERTIPLEQASINGLDYQDGLLYVCSNGNIYKCDVSSSFQILEAIQLEGFRANGIAFDGTNFWINASSIISGSHQIIKTNLTL